MQIGGVTIFGLPADVPIYIDTQVLEQSTVVMGGGNRSSKVVLSPAELRKLLDAQMVDIALG
jgi:prolyl-tRNA editing enzyme YbaK/EbsC (Cys-tRNA(Pro) deacylase)